MSLDNVKLLIQASTGYTVTDADTALLTYFYNSEEQDISNNCNLEALPDELIYVVEERAAARCSVKRRTYWGMAMQIL